MDSVRPHFRAVAYTLIARNNTNSTSLKQLIYRSPLPLVSLLVFLFVLKKVSLLKVGSV